MSLVGQQYSFAAGSTSLDPHGFRVIQQKEANRLTQMLAAFPILRRFINSSALYINGYPAALGLVTDGPLVDSYLHPPTFIRAMRLAVCERRHVVFTSQPLAGAEFLLRLCETEAELPTSILWAVGGYYLPVSLERALTNELARLGCDLTCLYAYGVAEIGHSCFAAMERDESGLPCFKHIAGEVRAMIDDDTGVLTLAAKNGRSVATGDLATRNENVWTIESSRSRLHASVRDALEGWSDIDWKYRTGYLFAEGARMTMQLRERVDSPTDSKRGDSQLTFYDFLKRFGGTFSSKPKWNLHDHRGSRRGELLATPQHPLKGTK